jgi:hypothetical protein
MRLWQQPPARDEILDKITKSSDLSLSKEVITKAGGRGEMR